MVVDDEHPDRRTGLFGGGTTVHTLPRHHPIMTVLRCFVAGPRRRDLPFTIDRLVRRYYER